MIERKQALQHKEVKEFYDEIYKYGGYLSQRPFNERMEKLLGVIPGRKLLDVACGQGTLCALLEDKLETHGIDISEEAIRKARQIAPKSKFKIGPGEKLPYPDEYFDYVTCLGSLEHFIDIEAGLREMRRVLVTGGKALIHVPNSRYIVHTILRKHTQGQINERLATEEEWAGIIRKFFDVEKCYAYNTRWYLQWIPKRWCCHFTFVCRKR